MKTKEKQKVDEDVSKAASAMAKHGQAKTKAKLGSAEYYRRLRERSKLGGEAFKKKMAEQKKQP